MKRYETCTTKSNSSGQQYQSCSNTNLILTYVYLALMFFWTVQVITNVLHTSIAGLFASYFFYEGTPEGYPSKNPYLSSLKRASIFSFGSICFGSLIVAILQTLRAILSYARSSNSDDPISVILIVCADCILSCIQSLLEYFNKYAYIEIAIYGKPFIKAAKDTWTLLTSKGIMALVNDCLVGNVVLMGSIAVGTICAIISYFLSLGIVNSVKSNNSNGILLAFIGFAFGVSIFQIINGVMTSGSSTTFVCLAEDPHAISRNHPSLYSTISSRYPDVVSGIER
ncbi:hypothetical protein BB560_004042 [Smittium megazygosporum]|uniref:Protein PNS1 n=1 Tax=Smittium megazygosporum TaxID=133381 RepID=A0A2T9ZAC0_9FUNG|nr:hypothetical protein BB560_004042 [Smittium megazygosporum]